MSKSRSGGSDGSRSNSVDCEEANHQQINIQTLMCSNSRPETPGTDNNALAVRSETIVPNSPPPSYEHVLEETRHAVEQGATSSQEEEERGQQRDDSQTSGNEAVTGGGRRTPVKGPEILHKSSKELYRAVAKQWGITCKMSDHCRCFDCQRIIGLQRDKQQRGIDKKSRYFDCEYERDEMGKTDGGLGAGTPMFISEVIHGTACTLL